MTTTELQKSEPQLSIVPADVSAAALELAVGKGDFSRLSPKDRLEYIGAVCKWVGLNPLTKPIDIIDIKGKTVLYANKSCAEQLRGIHKITVKITERVQQDGCYIVRALVKKPDGQEDESIGAVPCSDKASPDERANAMMKAETKAKRRATLSICGLGFMPDESELETIKDVRPAQALSQAETASDRAAVLGSVVEAEVVPPEAPPGKQETTAPESKNPSSSTATSAATGEPSTPSPTPASNSSAPSAPASQPPSADALSLKGADGKLTDEVVTKIEGVMMEKNPTLCIAYLVAKGKLAKGAQLNTLDATAANFILKCPRRFHSNVEDWQKTQK